MYHIFATSCALNKTFAKEELQMIQQTFQTQELPAILYFLNKYIERNEINISKLSKDAGINRKTLYNKLYSDKLDFDFISKLSITLGFDVKVSFIKK